MTRLSILPFGKCIRPGRAEKQQNSDLQIGIRTGRPIHPGMLLPGCYDEWIVPERERIHDLTVIALQKLITLQEQAATILLLFISDRYCSV